MNDRRIHAETDRFEIVRYERAGKWYVESKLGLIPAEQLRVESAAWRAVDAEEALGGTIYLGIPGGRVFDRAVVTIRARNLRVIA